MSILIIVIHLIVCFALIAIVLLQTGKGADMGAVFGGAGNQTLFGNTGASTFLGKATTFAAIIFMLTSLSLAYISKSGDESVMQGVTPAGQTQEDPMTQTVPIEKGKDAKPIPKGEQTDNQTPPAAEQQGTEGTSGPSPQPQEEAQ
jgi:preprotein translocase subunit SecG